MSSTDGPSFVLRRGALKQVRQLLRSGPVAKTLIMIGSRIGSRTQGSF
jgi:hypothetical protein